MKSLILVLFIVFCWHVNGLEIWYPGTFDPFHNTHADEVHKSLEAFPDAKIKILPIVDAYYNRDTEGNRRAFLFNFKERKKIIELSMTDKEVLVSDELKIIDDYVLDVLLSKIDKSEELEIKLLVGMDTLEKWMDLDRFDELLRVSSLIVGEDISDKKLNKLLKNKFVAENRITFIKPSEKSIRSVNVNKAILSKSKSVFDMMSEESVHFIFGDNYVQRNQQYINELERVIQNEKSFFEEMKSYYNIGLDKDEAVTINYKINDNELWVKEKGSWIKIASLKSLETDTMLFHWNSLENSKNWWKNGYVSDDQLNWRIMNRTNNLAGGGLYLSTSSLDSANYGNYLTSFKIPSSSLVAEGKELNTRLSNPKLTRKYNKLLRSIGITGVVARKKKAGGYWVNIIDSKALTNVRKGNLVDMLDYGITTLRSIDHYPLEYWLARYEVAQDKNLNKLFPKKSIWNDFFNNNIEIKKDKMNHVKNSVIRYFLNPVVNENYQENNLYKKIMKKVDFNCSELFSIFLTS